MSEPAAMVTRRIIITEELQEDGRQFLGIATEPEDNLSKWDVLGMLHWALLNAEEQCRG